MLVNTLGNTIGSRGRANATPIGEIFSDTFDRGSLGSNYTAVGGISTTMDGSDMIISGGASNYGVYNKYTAWGTCLENWEIVVEFEADTQAVAVEGISIGVKSNSAYGNRSVVCTFGQGTGGAKGVTYLLAGSSAPDNYSILSQTTSQGVVAGDEIRITLTRSGLTLTVLTENITQATSRTTSHTFSLLYSSATFMHNTGSPFIGTLGGTQKVHSWNFTTTEKKNIKTLFVGDSLTHGVSASTISNRWANEVMNGSSVEWAVTGGGGDYTTNTLTKIEELKLINPIYCVLQLGGNDIRLGSGQPTAETNYASIVNQLEAVGIQCIHLLAGADTNTDLTGWNTWLSANYTTIDCFTPLKDGGTGLNASYDCGDGTHWNDAGHDVNASTVTTNAPQIL
jgi:lysophospholipase L1-like esterase